VTLEIVDLHAGIEGKHILNGVNLKVSQGEIHAVMGPNGSGKSTLAYTILGHPKYKVTKGNILVNGESILSLTPDQRAKKGLFLAFQYPLEISGVPLLGFLRSAAKATRGDVKKEDSRVEELKSALQFRNLLKEKLKIVGFDESFATRYLNEGFSGGEKKRAEILQMAVLKPQIAVMDETDSGLDIDSVKVVANVVNSLAGPEMGVLLITHYQRILQYVKPDFVHVMIDGKVVRSGDKRLAEELEQRGYEWLEGEAPEQALSEVRS
jgi:Fe-S cluster assembly ATP-binding protein